MIKGETKMTETTTLEIRPTSLMAPTVFGIFPLFVEGTVQTSAEIQRDRITDKLLRRINCYTANFCLYDVENEEGIHDADGDAYLYFGGRKDNLIFSNLTEACRQLIQNSNYVPSAEDAARAKSSAVRVKLSDLELQVISTSTIQYFDRGYITIKEITIKDLQNDDNCRRSQYYEIDTTDYDSLNPSKRALAEAVHGSGQQFVDVMNMLREDEITKTRIYVLNPIYVKKSAKEQAVCRASLLCSDDSNFNADYSFVNCREFMRGEVTEMALEIEKVLPLFRL